MRHVPLILATLLSCIAQATAQTVPGTDPPQQGVPPLLNPGPPLFDALRWRPAEQQRLAERRLQDRLAARQHDADERERDQDLRRIWGDASRERAEDWRAHDDIARLRDLRLVLRSLSPPPFLEGDHDR